MMQLLTYVQTALRGSSHLSYMNTDSIYIAPTDEIVFFDRPYPQITITDGDIDDETEEDMGWERGLDLTLTIYQELKDGVVSLMGGTNPRIYGILEIERDIHKALFDNDFNDEDIETAVPNGAGGSEFDFIEDVPVLKKKIYYSYHKLENEP